MSNVEWRETQSTQRQRFKQADPEVCALYEEMAARKHKQQYRIAFSDYFKGNELLSKG